ncbi:MAG: translation elongation factor 4 [Candidatus Krumholzibacteria bacterium]|nr:translation elongation factor 4 [Candidatus Krumholzibacteria bacterium]
MDISQELIRNFCIIAHIDHGKSTLADRFLERTGTLDEKQMRAQVLDTMDLERERGITIKSHPIRMEYDAGDGKRYILNLIDTPGHVDFTYEVSRSLAACEGAILVVDAVQGVQAQTISNLHLAIDGGLEVIAVINKIDLPNARPDYVTDQILGILGGERDEVHVVSARDGTGVDDLLDAIIKHIPPPAGDRGAKLKALIFDSFFNAYKGAVVYVRVVDGVLHQADVIRLVSNNKVFETVELGYFRLDMVSGKKLSAGEVGYIHTGIKNLRDTKVGDTITLDRDPCAEGLPGFKELKSMVFSGLYPMNSDDYDDLREALEKLQLNDSAFNFEAESSVALGFGFRCGFLGLLHMEVIQERLEREYSLGLITTMPNVKYRVVKKDGAVVEVDNPANFPSTGAIERIEEPYVRADIITPGDYVGGIMKLNQDRRGIYVEMEYLSVDRARLTYELPLAEILVDYYDKLKSVSRGYASLDYEFISHRPSDLVRLDVALNGDPVDALSVIIHRDKAFHWGKELTSRLKEVIPRQLYEVAIQAVVGSRVIARTNVRALRKNVTAKCYGGDITRKRKLLEKQREGKKRMKMVGKIEVPQEAFLAVLKVDRSS